MGALPINGKPIKLNGAFLTLCYILWFVVASLAEAKLGALFLNCQEGMIFRGEIQLGFNGLGPLDLGSGPGPGPKTLDPTPFWVQPPRQ